MLDVLYPYATATQSAARSVESSPVSRKARPRTILLVEPDVAHLPDRAALLTEDNYSVTSVRDIRELSYLRDRDPFTVALLSDILGPPALTSAATSVRRYWPLARILILGNAARVLEDHLYDDTIGHSGSHQNLLDLLARLCRQKKEQVAPSPSEALLLAASLAGDTSSYHKLVHPYECHIFALALLYTQNQADAEDVTQHAFIEAFHRLESLRAGARFGALLVRLTLEEVQRRLRFEERAPAASSTNGPFLVQPPRENSAA